MSEQPILTKYAREIRSSHHLLKSQDANSEWFKTVQHVQCLSCHSYVTFSIIQFSCTSSVIYLPPQLPAAKTIRTNSSSVNTKKSSKCSTKNNRHMRQILCLKKRNYILKSNTTPKTQHHNLHLKSLKPTCRQVYYLNYMSYGQNLVHGEGTSSSRVGPYRFCSGGTLYKPS